MMDLSTVSLLYRIFVMVGDHQATIADIKDFLGSYFLMDREGPVR